MGLVFPGGAVFFRGNRRQPGPMLAGATGSKPAGVKRAESRTRLKPLPAGLKKLFQTVPKTELHCHLSGSTPIRTIRQFLKEQGWSREKILAETPLPDRYESLNDFLHNTYYKIPAHVKTPDQFRRATLALVKEAARENVRLLEVRTSITRKQGTPKEIVEAVEAGLREGMAWTKQKYGFDMRTGVIILAQRWAAPEASFDDAVLTVSLASRPNSMIVGLDLAGSETDHPLEDHARALRYIKKYGPAVGVKLTVHAGETPSSGSISGVASIRKALQLGVDRIGHGLQMFRDPKLMAEVARRKIPVEISPWSNVQLNSVPSYWEHPMVQLMDAGVNLNLNTDNRMVSKITLTKQLGQLYRYGFITTWQQVKTLVLNGVRAGFLNDLDKKRLEKEVQKAFETLESQEPFKSTIRQYLCDQQQSDKTA